MLVITVIVFCNHIYSAVECLVKPVAYRARDVSKTKIWRSADAYANTSAYRSADVNIRSRHPRRWEYLEYCDLLLLQNTNHWLQRIVITLYEEYRSHWLQRIVINLYEEYRSHWLQRIVINLYEVYRSHWLQRIVINLYEEYRSHWLQRIVINLYEEYRSHWLQRIVINLYEVYWSHWLCVTKMPGRDLNMKY